MELMKIKSDNFDAKITLQNSFKLKSRIDISLDQICNTLD